MKTPPSSDQLAVLLDPKFLGRTVAAFYKRRHPPGFTKPELLSEAADFVLTRYDVSKFSLKKKSPRANDATTALMVHAAVSIYNRLIRVIEEQHSEYKRKPTPLPLLPFELASEDRGERAAALALAEERMELLEAALDLDEHEKADQLREVIRLFRETENMKTVSTSMGMSGYLLQGLFRWARKRYRAVLN